MTCGLQLSHHGPVETESIGDRTIQAYQRGPEAVIALVGEIVAELMGRIVALETENQALRARLGTNSRNSGKPPSSDGPGIKPHPKSQRKPSGRKSGGQPGHPGHTLRLVDEPDEVKVHAPSHCTGCGESLAEVPAVRRERRQVVDIPLVKALVVEHQVETKCCPGCGMETSGVFPQDVKGPMQYGARAAAAAVYFNQAQLLPQERTCEVMEELFGCPMVEGTLESAVGQCHEQLADTEAAIKRGIEGAEVAHFDETGTNVGGKSEWLHVASTGRLTFYAIQKKRGREALDAIGLLPNFFGRAIHDGFTSYWQYRQCEHGLCNAHHLRELTFVEEELGQVWAKDQKELLLQIKQAVEDARNQGQEELPTEMKGEFSARYDVLLEIGFKANPPPEPTGKAGRPKLGKAGNLLERLRAHKGETLAFMEDFSVPFDNNQAERDIRMVKVRQKISGCFRTTTGAERFCRIRGYISSLRKQGMPVLAALGSAIVGNPPMPATT